MNVWTPEIVLGFLGFPSSPEETLLTTHFIFLSGSGDVIENLLDSFKMSVFKY